MATDHEPSSSPRTYVVLCVDDHVAALVTRKAFLETFGYTVQTVTNGPAALSLVQRVPPDVVLLDYHMPGMDGLEVLQRLRAILPELPVIVLTGYVKEMPPEMLELAFTCLPKGAAPNRLLEALREALGSLPLKPVLPRQATVEKVRDHLEQSIRHASYTREKSREVKEKLIQERKRRQG